MKALPVEYLAVRAYLSDLKESVHEEGTVYEIGTFPTHLAIWKVAILEAGVGNVPAGIDAERALATFRPDVALFVGIAGDPKTSTSAMSSARVIAARTKGPQRKLGLFQ